LQATRIRPDTRPTDLRRLTAAGLSALIPGLGQLFNGRRRLAALFLVPSLVLLTVAVVIVRTESPARLAAWVVSPQVMGLLLALNVVVLVWRLVAVGQAFLDTRRTGPTGWLGVAGIAVIGIVVIVPHAAVYRYGTALEDTFDRIFSGAVLGASDEAGSKPGPVPGDGERVNVLLIGIDKRPPFTENLTDTMMVASLDPVGRTVSIVSLPRDLIGTPLGNGDVFGPKLNSLMSYADRHPDAFPQGGIRALEDATGALLGIPIHYYAKLDFVGFIKIVDAVGGVDITVDKGFDDPTYDGYQVGGYRNAVRGFSITAGRHHLDGVTALAYARSRKANGESDFTRQARQQQILVALRDQVARGGSLLFQLPDLLEAVGQTIRTDVPVERLPALAAILEEVGKDDVIKVVIRAPLIKPKNTRYGSSQAADLTRIRAMAAALFPAPGADPAPWPTPKPTKTLKPAKASPTP
jgi:polyisoprenyl-teichoic acid--peptidoglycan teichoic acid transferase